MGIDPDRTTVTTATRSVLNDGRRVIEVQITPRDRYDNHLGPGRSTGFSVSGAPGNEPTGAVLDNGDGSYTQLVTWDPRSGTPPGVVLGQPDRPPVVVSTSQGPGAALACLPWALVLALVVVVAILIVLLAI